MAVEIPKEFVDQDIAYFARRGVPERLLRDIAYGLKLGLEPVNPLTAGESISGFFDLVGKHHLLCGGDNDRDSVTQEMTRLLSPFAEVCREITGPLSQNLPLVIFMQAAFGDFVAGIEQANEAHARASAQVVRSWFSEGPSGV